MSPQAGWGNDVYGSNPWYRAVDPVFVLADDYDNFHVYESPGIYNARLTVTDGTNTVVHPMTIHIDDPDVYYASTTQCYSISGDFTGCPVCSDASHPDCSIGSVFERIFECWLQSNQILLFSE